eukprot:34175_1
MCGLYLHICLSITAIFGKISGGAFKPWRCERSSKVYGSFCRERGKVESRRNDSGRDWRKHRGWFSYGCKRYGISRCVCDAKCQSETRSYEFWSKSHSTTHGPIHRKTLCTH